MANHKSDCAVHNAPAAPKGPCDCGASPSPREGDGATARPWRLDNDAPGQDAQLSSVYGADGTLVIAGEGDGWMTPFSCSENGKANARLVIEAVNQHASLLARVERLEGALSLCLDELRHICSVGDRPITRGIALGQSVLYGEASRESK